VTTPAVSGNRAVADAAFDEFTGRRYTALSERFSP
jgi:hypothetical protein